MYSSQRRGIIWKIIKEYPRSLFISNSSAFLLVIVNYRRWPRTSDVKQCRTILVSGFCDRKIVVNNFEKFHTTRTMPQKIWISFDETQVTALYFDYWYFNSIPLCYYRYCTVLSNDLNWNTERRSSLSGCLL